MAMIQQDILINAVNKITELGVPYMLTGGVAALFYGKPRMTHDIDVVIEIDRSHIPRITQVFGEGFYVSEEAIREALVYKSMFNVIHVESGIKIDFWIKEDNEYDLQRFSRRQKHTVSGHEMFFSSPEDTILKKLLWYKDSEIDKHLDDARGILQVQNENLDFGYLRKWANSLSVANLLNQLTE